MLSLFKKNKKEITPHNGTVCLNCNTMLNGDENFCPNCGQKNKSHKITFSSFSHEVFAGFTSWDTKFWKTIIPLITKPGKVSKDYIEGKRIRYTNPFRFYLTTSIIFFLLIGANDTYNKIKKMSSNQIATLNTIEIKNDSIAKQKSDSIARIALQNVNKTLDSINKKYHTEIDTSNIKIPKNKKYNYSVGGSEVSKMVRFRKKHPNLPMDQALDSLKMGKNFINRFWYSKTDILESVENDPEELKKVAKEMLSYTSIALFFLLPILAIFLKLLYIRKNYTYVEHLVFVFHLQTVFFLLAILFFFSSLIKASGTFLLIFLFAFLFYLYKAMRKFYQQGRFKTIIKFITINITFFFLASIGTVLVAMVAFALY